MSKKQDTCDVFFVDEAKVKAVQKKLDSDGTVQTLAETFKLLSSPTRVKIIMALAEAELCGCDLAALLGVSRPAVSHQLRLLKNLRLVKYHREGQMVYYALKDAHINNLLREGLRHVKE